MFTKKTWQQPGKPPRPANTPHGVSLVQQGEKVQVPQLCQAKQITTNAGTSHNPHNPQTLNPYNHTNPHNNLPTAHEHTITLTPHTPKTTTKLPAQLKSHQIRTYQKQQRPPTKIIHDQQGNTRGITRQYLNPRTIWIATQAPHTLKGTQQRIQDLKNRWNQYTNWTNPSDKYWLQLSLTMKHPVKCWNYNTNLTATCNLNNNSILLLLEGMTKIYTQLQLPIPTLHTITQQITETAECYAHKTITLNQNTNYQLPTGDMAAIDYRLYSILINHFKINTELFAWFFPSAPVRAWVGGCQLYKQYIYMFTCKYPPHGSGPWSEPRTLVTLHIPLTGAWKTGLCPH